MLKKHLQYQNLQSTSQSPLPASLQAIPEVLTDSVGTQELFFGGKSLASLLKDYVRPCFVYDLDLLSDRFHAYQKALSRVSVHYALKANSHPSILRHLQSLGCGIDAVSGGEVLRALECGFHPSRIILSGVAKTVKEIELAIARGIHQINVESLPELQRIGIIAEKMQKKVAIALRLNPDIEIDTHKYISTGLLENKFGIELAVLPDLIAILRGNPWLVCSGVSLHLGSQMMEFSGFREALKITKRVFKELRSEFSTCQRFDVGGGLGVIYENIELEREFSMLQEYAQVISEELVELQKEEVQLQSEPGRWLVAHAGILICQVQYIKVTSQRVFVITDSGMNHLIRPSLYEAYHWITPWLKRSGFTQVVDIVGPICESSDFFGRARALSRVQENDFLVIADCGAYGAAMSSEYNLQDRADEHILG